MMETKEQFIKHLDDYKLEAPSELTAAVIDLFFTLANPSTYDASYLYQKLTEYVVPVPESQTGWVFHQFSRIGLRKNTPPKLFRKPSVASVY